MRSAHFKCIVYCPEIGCGNFGAASQFIELKSIAETAAQLLSTGRAARLNIITFLLERLSSRH